jgi:hypothetical protein
MTPTEFQALKYGNIISDGNARQQLMVIHTNRDDQDNVTAIVALPCFLVADAATLTVVDATGQQTVLLNPNLGPSPDILGILKTIPEK